MKTFPMLYKKSSTGAIVEWQIAVKGNVITTVWGQRGGQKQTAQDVVKEGKNTGRVNATTPDEQALAEAEATWTKKLKKDYVRTLDSAEAGESSELVADGVPLPMLAHKYKDHSDKVVWPAACQPKLDGTRMLAIVDKAGKCTLWSRTRKPILSLPHIVRAVEAQCKPGIILDGEAYAHDYHDRFEELISLIRSEDPQEGHEAVEYWVYDCIQAAPFSQRTKAVAGLSSPLVSVETEIVCNEEELRQAYARYMEAGFEGAILRWGDKPYEHKRSTQLLKVKERDDAEFEVIGVEEGRGKLTGHGIFLLHTKSGKEFKAKMKGDTEALRDYWKNSQKYIGAWVTVAYQGLTADGIPRFPVALRFRKDV